MESIATTDNNNTNLDLALPLLQEQRRRTQESSFLLYTQYPNLEMRLRKERHLLFAQWKTLLGSCFFLNYFVLIVFRNLVYFRYNNKLTPLKDLGHEFVPRLDASALTEAPIFIMFAILVFCSIGAFIGHERSPEESAQKPYFVNALRRTLVMFSLGHFLRALTYLSTNLPGPALHCQAPEFYDPPPTIESCFYRLVSQNGNCGDLNFSGHMFLFHLGTLYISTYGRRFWSQPLYGRFHMITTSTSLTLSLIQLYCILATRHHYTVDVVLASYVAPLLWSFLDEHHNDLEPDEGMIESELVRESTWPRWWRICYFLTSLVILFVFILSLAFSFAGNFRLVHADKAGDNSTISGMMM